MKITYEFTKKELKSGFDHPPCSWWMDCSECPVIPTFQKNERCFNQFKKLILKSGIVIDLPGRMIIFVKPEDK